MQTILFNHIPKTGGVTLRIIFNRVYGEENVFLVKSTDIKSSLEEFRRLSDLERKRFRVVAGHGADLFRPYMDNPFTVVILREPVSLFLSQFYYLKISENSAFYDDVRKMGTLEEYIEYAFLNGQDNLLTRYLSGAVEFLADPSQSAPDLSIHGESMLEQAMDLLPDYDIVIDLDDFNAGVFALSEKLGWKKTPLFRRTNTNRENPGVRGVPGPLLERLREVLKYDIDLYDFFRSQELSSGLKVDRNSMRYRRFSLRQKAVRIASGFIGKY